MAMAKPRGDRPVGLPITVGRENVEESVAIINTLRASRNLAPITADHLQLEPFVTIDLRFNKLVPFASRQVELFVEGYNVLNRINYAGGGNRSIISPAFLIRNAARDPRQIQLGARVSF